VVPAGWGEPAGWRCRLADADLLRLRLRLRPGDEGEGLFMPPLLLPPRCFRRAVGMKRCLVTLPERGNVNTSHCWLLVAPSQGE
jgi:hypothetical protein